MINNHVNKPKYFDVKSAIYRNNPMSTVENATRLPNVYYKTYYNALSMIPRLSQSVVFVTDKIFKAL